jgi:3'-phosphoadenosine 5'-phosphosulfate sulfotransferase (PAPS reductase)/FAD synthetase
MIEVLSLGAGVQSTTVLLMSIKGELPKLDHAIFADTGWEPKAVYDQLEWLTGEAEGAGIKVHIVRQGNIREDALRSQVRVYNKAKGERWSSLPYFTTDRKTGKHGMVRRQCTYEYKIRPIEKCLRRDILGLRPRQHAPNEPVIRQWRGISLDEWRRVRASDHKWMVTWHPLVDRKITRAGCHEWLRQNDYPEAPRSACIGCPFHHDDEWRHLKNNSPAEWQDAVEFDKAIRKCGGMRGDTFLHSARVPLDEVDLSTDVDSGQLMLWQDECSGMCGV